MPKIYRWRGYYNVRHWATTGWWIFRCSEKKMVLLFQIKTMAPCSDFWLFLGFGCYCWFRLACWNGESASWWQSVDHWRALRCAYFTYRSSPFLFQTCDVSCSPKKITVIFKRVERSPWLNEPQVKLNWNLCLLLCEYSMLNSCLSWLQSYIIFFTSFSVLLLRS